MNVERDFSCFLASLIEAGAKIDSHYFKQHVTGSKKPIFRERVYCYEFYHQLRCILGDDFPYKLDGELDKQAHPILAGQKKPDFVVHVPGNMDRNLAVIEVKRARANHTEIRGDIKKLKGFLDTAEYYKAIMLIYGDENSNVKYARSEINSLPKEYAERILLVWHKKPEEKPEVVQISKP